MLEYFSHLYTLPLIGVVIGLFIYHIYSKFEKKELTKKDYFKCGALIYLVCFTLLFLQQNSNVLSSITTSSILTDSKNSLNIDNNLQTTLIGFSKSNIETNNGIEDMMEIDMDNIFNTGHPSF
jgi:hypothetical protein